MSKIRVSLVKPIDIETVKHENPITYHYQKYIHKFPVFGDVAYFDDISDGWMENPERIKNKEKEVRWDQSVYYWWFEYLKRHKGYRKYCETLEGDFKKLYSDFGNIHFSEHYFMKWFCYGGCQLFCEQDLPGNFEEAYDPIEFVNGQKASFIASQRTEYLYLAIPIENNRKRLLRQFDEQITRIKTQRDIEFSEAQSTALYPVHMANPNTNTLSHSLKVWDLKEAGLKNRQIYERVFGKISDREIIRSQKDEQLNAQAIDRIRSQKYQKQVKRSFDHAEALIRNVGFGKFPCTD